MRAETDEEETNGRCLLSCVSNHLNTTSPVVNADLLEGITVTLQVPWTFFSSTGPSIYTPPSAPP